MRKSLKKLGNSKMETQIPKMWGEMKASLRGRLEL